MAKIASMIITTVIAVTTEFVVPSPRLSVLDLILKPKWQEIKRYHHAAHHAFAQPQPQIGDRLPHPAAYSKKLIAQP